MADTTVTFSNDILPMFAKWQSRMICRLDLCDYNDVVANADAILDQMQGGGMPPPPYDPLTQEQYQIFLQWTQTGFAQ
jgi:trans-aconitate methyltransferase